MRVVKRRYLALEVDSDQVLGPSEFMDAVWAAVSKLYGEYGASRAGLSLISFDAEQRLAVVRTGHLTLEMVRTALATITRFGDKPAAVHVLRVSGTIKALHRKMKV